MQVRCCVFVRTWLARYTAVRDKKLSCLKSLIAPERRKEKHNKQERVGVYDAQSLTQAQALRVAHHRSDALALATNNLGDERVGRKRRAAHDRAVGHTAVGHAQRRVVEITAVGAAECVPGAAQLHSVRGANACVSVS